MESILEVDIDGKREKPEVNCLWILVLSLFRFFHISLAFLSLAILQPSTWQILQGGFVFLTAALQILLARKKLKKNEVSGICFDLVGVALIIWQIFSANHRDHNYQHIWIAVLSQFLANVADDLYWVSIRQLMRWNKVDLRKISA